ncbi:MAG: histidine kinase [Bifidobacteriaceae bacterium]|jgi:signal transduction histidine kinase|nr:histidine kinase [Bifidobacteriaceae bacterium]
MARRGKGGKQAPLPAQAPVVIQSANPADGAPAIPRPGPIRRFAERHPLCMDITVAVVYLFINLVIGLGVTWVDPTTGEDVGPLVGGASSATATPSPTVTATPSPSATAQPSPVATVTVTVTAAPSPEASASASPEPITTISVGPSSDFWTSLEAARWMFIALTLLGAVAILLLRRRHPVWLLTVVCLLNLGYYVVTSTGDPFLYWIALFAVAQRASVRAAWTSLAVVCVEEIGCFLWTRQGASGLASSLGPELLIHVALVAIFIHFGNRRRYVGALVERAHYLAVERDQRAQIAVAEERTRIAREMHDVVAHSLAVMVTLSDGAASAARKNPEVAAKAMEKVSETGRQAVGDMRRLLAVLRSDADLTPQPGAADLVPLVGSFRDSGLPVQLELSAALPEDAALALTVYRIVQESLTNVLRHCPHTPGVLVAVTEPQPDLIDIEVVNEPQTVADAGPGWDGSKQGLVGMRQRVEVYNGTLEAGPTAVGGWRVHATLHHEQEENQ